MNAAALVELDLSHNPIGDEAAKEIAEVVALSPNLRSLSLAGVNMTSRGLKLMFEALQVGPPPRA